MLDAFLAHHSQRLTDVPGNVQRVLHRNRSTLDGPGQRSVSLLTPFHMPGKPRNRNLERRGMFRIPTFRIARYTSTESVLQINASAFLAVYWAAGDTPARPCVP